jgi:hypothetical protein
MTALAPTLEAFFTDRLMTQRDASPKTIAAYRDAFRLLLAFVHEQTGKQPFQLDLADLDAPLIGAFLNDLEQDRGNSPRRDGASYVARTEQAAARRTVSLPRRGGYPSISGRAGGAFCTGGDYPGSYAQLLASPE